MIDYPVTFICSVYHQFGVSVQSLLGSDNPKAELHPSFLEAYSRLGAFWTMDEHKHIFLDDDLASRLWLLREQLKGGEKFTGEMLARDLQGLYGQMQRALHKRKFAYIPPPNDAFFEQEKLFGDDVYEKFPKARVDIKDAGNAFAASLYTACIFHLMRAGEHGLRRLGKKLKIVVTHTKTIIPIEYGEWDKIITLINNKIATARALPTGPKRQRLLEIYSDASQHCLFMKDIWRNTASHARKEYSDPEALAAMGRVKEFLQFLAKGMK